MTDASALHHAIERLGARWMTGGGTADSYPEEWRALVEGADPAERELRLLAVAGQALQIAFEPTPPDGLAARPDLPRLALPTIPEPLRPRFRRVLAQCRSDARLRAGLLVWLAARGWVSHPADWAPAGDEAAPDVYAPWIAWAEAAQGEREIGAALTAETWDDWTSAERRVELAAMRRRDPGAARELIAAKAPTEPAERRLRLLGVLEEGLTEADAPALERFASDRAPKVAGLASMLLARLGLGVAAGASERELAGFLKVDTKVLGRKMEVFATRTKTGAQVARRDELFPQVALSGLAEALGMTREELVEAWRIGGDPRATTAFMTLVAETGADEHVALLAERVLASRDYAIADLPVLARRLPDERLRLAESMLSDPRIRLEDVVSCAGDRLGALPAPALLASPVLADVLAAIEGARGEEASSARVEKDVGDSLFFLGLLAGHAAAGEIFDAMTRAGLSPADPKLELLRLGAALPETTHETTRPSEGGA